MTAETQCPAVRDIGEHVRGSFIIDPGTLDVVGYRCLFCGARLDTLLATEDTDDAG